MKLTRSMIKPVCQHIANTAVITLLLPSICVAADTPPGSNIYVADLIKSSHSLYQISNIQQITKRKGYDNQPTFLPDNSGILYTAILPTADGKYQADSFEYRFKTQKHTNLTNSHLSEYSPTLMQEGKRFSSVVVETDNKQHLWAYPFKNELSKAQLSDVEPVGYHAWGENGSLAMFVLGEPQTLQFADGKTNKLTTIASNIGRSLRYLPERNTFSFTELKQDKQWWLSEFSAATLKVTPLAPLPKESSYYTWIDHNTAVTAVDSKLFVWEYTNSKKQTRSNWQFWFDTSAICSTKISRLAVNNNHTKLAFVCDE